MRLDRLPTRGSDGVHVVVETPRGARAKLKYEPALGAFTLARQLFGGLTYPFDWGFFPGTRADDGDPLDAMILHDVPTFPGLVLVCRLVGVLEVEEKETPDEKKWTRNDRIFAVPVASREEPLTAARKDELERFFRASVEKIIRFVGWKGADTADKLLSRAERVMKKR